MVAIMLTGCYSSPQQDVRIVYQSVEKLEIVVQKDDITCSRS